MAYTPPAYNPSGSLFSYNPLPSGYSYGNFGVGGNAYPNWGSTGNPYYLPGGPGYTPGSGAPAQAPQQPAAPVQQGSSDGDYTNNVTASNIEYDGQGLGNLGMGDKYLLGSLIPGAGLASSLITGRFDGPGGSYSRLPWYEGSAGGGYGYTQPGYDKYAPGDSDRGIYDATTGERAWDDSFDDYNTGDLWAETGVFEGIGNIFSGTNWDGSEKESTPYSGTPSTVNPYTGETLSVTAPIEYKNNAYKNSGFMQSLKDGTEFKSTPAVGNSEQITPVLDNISPVNNTLPGSIDKLSNNEKAGYVLGSAAALKGAEYALNRKGIGKGYVPNSVFEKNNPGLKGGAKNWWTSGSSKAGNFGNILGAKPTLPALAGTYGLMALTPNNNIMSNDLELASIGLNPDGSPMEGPYDFGTFTGLGNNQLGDTDAFGNEIATDDFGNVVQYDRDADVRAQQMNRNAFGREEMDGFYGPDSLTDTLNNYGAQPETPADSAVFNKNWSKYGGDLLTGTTPKTFGDPYSAESVASRNLIAIDSAKAEQAMIASEDPAQAARDAGYVGTAEDGYAATANRYGTTPGSEQTAMLAEQDMGTKGQSVGEAIASRQPFGQQGDDSWSPDGNTTFHGPGYNWNGGEKEANKEVGTRTDPDSHGGGSGDSDGSGGMDNSSTAAGDAEGGFSQEDSDFANSGFDDDSGGGDSGGGGGGSYIATAATQSLGTAGLTVFNNWRDYMHTWHPTFTTSFGRYRVTAPEIVKVIDSKDNSKELYKEIWEEHLKPIYDLIVNKDDDKALVKYKVMVKELMNKYLKGDK